MFDILPVYKFIKTLAKTNVLSIYITKNKTDKIVFDAGYTKHEQNILNQKNKPKIPEELKFDIEVIIKAKKLKETCSRINNYGEVVEITCTKNDLKFKYVDHDTTNGVDIYSVNSEYEDYNATINFGENVPSTMIYQGHFNVNNLMIFGKCYTLCEDVRIALRNNYLMFISSTIGTLGVILIGITPHDNKQYDQSTELFGSKQIQMIEK